MVGTLNTVLSVGALAAAAASVALLVLYRMDRANPIVRFVSRNALLLLTLVTGAALAGSLVYSGGVGYAPCNLCWWQRAAIAGAFVLSLVGLVKKDQSALRYIQVFVLLGLVVSLYHNYIDLGGAEAFVCDTTVSCTQRYVAEFGFVTIPLMAGITLFTAWAMAFIGRKAR